MKKVKVISAGIIPIKFVDMVPQFLLLRCGDYWDFPKGGVENSETELEAAKRETQEEAGITSEQLDFVWGFEHYETEVYRRGKVAKYYMALVSNVDIKIKPNPITGRIEHNEFRWFDYKDASAHVGERIFKVLSWAVNKINYASVI